MNKLKGFYLQNKQLVMLTASVVIGVFLIFAIIAVIINNNGGEKEGKATSNKVAVTDDKKDDSTDISTIDDGDETETAALQEETTEEQETERETVDPYTLPYMIMVNRAANCITIYENDGSGNFNNPIKAIVCSTGKEEGDTPLGKFSTLISYKWLRMVDDSYGQYAYRFYGSILFHSVPYFSQDKGDLEWEQFNKLGEAASLGCVRVCVADAMWLIDNCPVGTMVEVYDNADDPGPLGKPEMIKIPEDSPYKGWDPTDPDKNNPWNNCKPEIKANKTKATVYVHASERTVLSELGVTGYDTCGNEVTEKVSLGGLDINRAGVYTVKLNLIDAIGRKADEVIVTVEVKNKEVTTTQEKTTENKTTTGETGTKEDESTTDMESTGDNESTEKTSGENGQTTQETTSQSESTTTPESTTTQESDETTDNNSEINSTTKPSTDENNSSETETTKAYSTAP